MSLAAYFKLTAATMAVVMLLFGAGFAQEMSESRGRFEVVGHTGVSAMHMVVISPSKVLIIDKAERNPAVFEDYSYAWSVEYNLKTNTYRPLRLHSDTFCSAGAFLGNGTLVESAGGDGMRITPNGARSVRIYHPCEQCNDRVWTEFRTGLETPRWYNTMITLPDGSILNVGGSTTGTSMNNERVNNPSYELYPQDRWKKPRHLEFLIESLPFNLYPAVHVIPNQRDQAFLFANVHAVVWDWVKNEIVRNLPKIPGPPRSYPYTGTHVMLPITYRNNYRPEILICGGQGTHKANAPATDDCGRIDLDDDQPTWAMEKFGGKRRVMPDSVILPDGNVLFVNGAGTGFAGYARRVPGGMNQHTALEPVLEPSLYKPHNQGEERWETMAASDIPRMYHSTATLIPDGTVLVGGSNPQPDVTKDFTDFPTEYRAEVFYPPYYDSTTPQPNIIQIDSYKELNDEPVPVNYGQRLDLIVEILNNNVHTEPNWKVVMIHIGFNTHSSNMGARNVELEIVAVERGDSSSGDVLDKQLWRLGVMAPPNGYVIAPGPSYVFVLNGDKPSHGIQVMLNPA